MSMDMSEEDKKTLDQTQEMDYVEGGGPTLKDMMTPGGLQNREAQRQQKVYGVNAENPSSAENTPESVGRPAENPLDKKVREQFEQDAKRGGSWAAPGGAKNKT